MTIEEKVALENRVKKISREAYYVVDRIDDIAKEIRRCSRCCSAVCAYKKLLKQNVASVNNYRFTNKPKRNLFTHTREFLTIYI